MIGFEEYMLLKESEEVNEKEIFSLESSIDYPESLILCPDIWDIGDDGQYHLKNDVRQKLQSIVNLMPNWAIKTVHIIGSLCSNLYNSTTDLDLHFVIDTTKYKSSDIDQVNKILLSNPELIVKVDKSKLSIGTHPIELYLQQNEYQDEASVGCYDFMRDVWITQPEILPLDYDPYEEYADIIPLVNKWGMRVTQSLMYLRNAVIDIDILLKSKSPNPANVKKLEKIISDKLAQIVEIKTQLSDLRKNTTQPTNSEEAAIVRNSKKQKNANALYKFMQRYGFIKICNMLKQEFDAVNSGHLPIATHVAVLKSILHIA